MPTHQLNTGVAKVRLSNKYLVKSYFLKINLNDSTQYVYFLFIDLYDRSIIAFLKVLNKASGLITFQNFLLRNATWN